MRDLKLKYILELVSNIGSKAASEAQVLEEAQRRMNRAVSSTADQVLGLDKALAKVGSNTSTERQIGYMQRLAGSVDAVSNKVQRLRQQIAKGIDKAPELAAQGAAGYAGAKTMMAPPLRAFSNLESATAELKISMLDAKGQVSADFGRISDEAVKLGNQLPGTTKDFMLAARALQTQSVPSSVIAGGGLRASSYVGALLNMDQVQSAEVIAKLREAHGLKDDELVKAADLVQRGFFGFGIKPQEYLESAKYAATTYNTMGISGYEKTKQTLAIQGMAANEGLEASSFGTNYSMMLTRLAQIDDRKNKKSKEAQEVREMLAEHKIDMQFYDDKGSFMGNVNMLQQLVKLRALNPLEQTKTINKLFGVEAGRPAQMLVQKGLEGYNQALTTIDSQASLDQRISMKMETFAAKLESLVGTIENVQARIATQLGQALKPAMDGGNNLLGGPVGDFFEKHPGVGTAGLVGAGAAGAYLSGRVGGALWKSLILRGAPAADAAGSVAPAVTTAAQAGLSATARAASLLKYGGITATLGAGLEGIGILADDKADKGREFSRLGVTTGTGLLGGVAAGAALGSVVPGFGTAIGVILGGLAGSFGSGALFDAVWQKKSPQERQAAERQQFALGAQTLPLPMSPRPFAQIGQQPPIDFLTLTAPGQMPLALSPGKATEIKIGEGTLEVNVRVTDDRVTATSTVTQPMSIIRVNAGSTNPGGFRP